MLPFNSTLELSDILIWFALIPNSVFLPGKNLISYIFVGYTPWTYFWRSKIESMMVGHPEIVDKAFTEGQTINATGGIPPPENCRNAVYCACYCGLTGSAQCQRCFLPFWTRNEPGLCAHSTCLTDCMELGHFGWCNASSKHETLHRYHTGITHACFNLN